MPDLPALQAITSRYLWHLLLNADRALREAERQLMPFDDEAEEADYDAIHKARDILGPLEPAMRALRIHDIRPHPTTTLGKQIGSLTDTRVEHDMASIGGRCPHLLKQHPRNQQSLRVSPDGEAGPFAHQRGAAINSDH